MFQTEEDSLLLLIGLGNPGGKYHNTRHNIGFMALDSLTEHITQLQEKHAKKWNCATASGVLPSKSIPKILAELNPKKFEKNKTEHENSANSKVSSTIKNEAHEKPTKKHLDKKNNFTLPSERKVLLAKPLTYMNLSGQAVLKLKSFYRSEISNMLVISDDLDFPFGEIRFKKAGSGGSHNGLKSIVEHVGKNFYRLRLGVGNPMQKVMPTDRFVLSKFNENETPVLNEYLAKIAEAIVYFSFFGIDKAMNAYNAKLLLPQT